MTTMIEHRVNGNRLVNAPALFAKAKDLYVKQGLAISYGLVYSMFPGIGKSVVERILNGEITTYTPPGINTVICFLEAEEIVNG